jgi:hypothetical protein
MRWAVEGWRRVPDFYWWGGRASRTLFGSEQLKLLQRSMMLVGTVASREDGSCVQLMCGIQLLSCVYWCFSLLVYPNNIPGVSKRVVLGFSAAAVPVYQNFPVIILQTPKRVASFSVSSNARSPRFILIRTQRLRVIPMLLQVLPEPHILKINRILLDIRHEDQRDDAGEDAQRTGDEEWILALLDWVVAAGCNNAWEDVCAHESTNFANSSSNAIILTTDRSGAGLGRNKTDVVARSELTKREEDAVDDNEAADLAGLIEMLVNTGHEETDCAL